MELRSSRVLKREKANIDPSLGKGNSPDEKKLSLSSGKSPSVKKGASEAEWVCVDNADEDLEMNWSNGSNSVILEGTKDGVNMDDKGLFLGSEVLDPIKDLVVSCPEAVKEESVECVQVECSVNHTGSSGEEGNKSASINLSGMDPGFKEEIKSPHMISTDNFHLKASAPTSPHVEIVDCENGSEHVESGEFADDITLTNGDEDKETSAADLDDLSLFNDSENANAGMVKSRPKKGKGRRGRKEINSGNLKKNESNHDSDTRRNEIEVEETAGSLHVECQEKADVGSSVDGDNGECTPVLVKCKRGRKRKNVESSECNGDGRAKKEKVSKGGIQVSGRVLRSRTMTISGSVKVVDSGLSGTVVGLKRMTRDEFQTGVDESTQLTGRPKKMLKRRGRPPKVQGETMPSHVFIRKDESTQLTVRPKKKLKRRGRPPKVQGETMPSHVLKKDGSMTETPKKFKRRGRPPKVQYETMPSHEIPLIPMKCRGRPRKDMMFKKLKRRGRPPKMEARNLATHVIKMRTVKLMAVKNRNSQLKANDVKRGPKTQNMPKEDGLSEFIGENQQKVQQSEENSEHMMDEDAGHNAGKGIISEQLEKHKHKHKQLVRDQIVDILLKAGWKIDRRPRQERTYKDAVYIEPSGRSHWSITRAYSKLKKKIEDGDADSNEVSAFTPVPEEEMSMLFRSVTKASSNKNKKNRIGEIVTCRKKKPGKKTKDGSKRKMIWNSAARLANKSSNVKLRGDKSHCEDGIIAGSSVRGRSRLSQEGNQSRKPSLLARSSEKGSKQNNDGCLVYSGKCNLLSWMIDLGVILPGWKVQYGKTRRQKRSSEGTITSDGIHCSCCNEIMGISKFVSHAGGKLSQHFDNIYLESGTSLLKCLLDSWRREEESNTFKFNLVDVKGDDPNDDACNICGDGGNLICCDGCPSTFHQSCLDIQNFPSGDWNCIFCSCKFCGVVSVSAPQVDDSHDVLTSEMLSCCLCEEKFHRLCLQEVEAVNIDSSRLPFCGRKCQELFERLQTYLGVKLELEDGFSWTLLQRSDVGQDFTVHNTRLKVECNSKLAVAFSVMDECFVPIVDERSGTSIIHNVVYNCGSNFRRLNYAGFLTAVLEKGDEFITAASIRIHGYRLAEMPFIGTRHMYRRQGMCRRLLDAVESTLSSLGVEELIIPAIPELLQTWTKVFGFMPLQESKRQAMKCMNMMVFPGIDMLQKPLLQNQSADRNPSPSAAVECTAKPNDKSVSQFGTMSANAIDYKQRPADAVGIGKDAIDYEQTEETTVLMDGCSCPEPNDKSVSQFGTMSSNAIDYKQRPVDTAGIGKDVIDYEQTEETTVLMDGCSCPEQNDKSVSRFETMSSNAIDYEQRPADAAGVGKDAIDYEQAEEATVLMDGCSCPKPNDKSVSQTETMSPNAINYKQRPAEAAGVGKDAIDYEQTKEITVLMDFCSCPDEDVTHLENDKLTTNHGANSLCDLNFPEKNVTCQVPETTGQISSDAKSDIPMQYVPCDTDVQTSDDSLAHELSMVAFVESQQLPPSKSFPDHTVQHSSMASVTCRLHESPESELGVHNDGIPGAKAATLISKLAPKNTFDLNLHPTVVDIDMHLPGDHSLPSEPQVCTKSFELSDSRSQVEHSAGSLPDSKPCDTQPLVLL